MLRRCVHAVIEVAPAKPFFLAERVRLGVYVPFVLHDVISYASITGRTMSCLEMEVDTGGNDVVICARRVQGGRPRLRRFARSQVLLVIVGRPNKVLGKIEHLSQGAL